ncbi:hypothetical protein [Streptomyces sp. NPDC017260]|uniref:hypothetical protein n=1 Tax=unclassified Streptomyces TaxID=2593676 RepID=UPI0037A2B8AB
MSYAPSRSLTGELNQGLIDQTYKTVNRDRGGAIDPATQRARADLNDVWFGIHETPVKQRPDGSAVRTPTYVPTPPAHLFPGM